MTQETVINTLVVYADYTDRLSYYNDWIDAFESSKKYNCQSINLCGKADFRKKINGSIDLIVLLHSTNGDTIEYLKPIVPLLARRSAKLVIFVGNEVNLPGSPISGKRDIFSKIEPEFIVTQLPLDAGAYLWGDIATVDVLELPHALNPEIFKSYISQEDRPIDLGVRAVKYIPHLGDNDRNRLHDYFKNSSFNSKLTIDISSERFNRQDWCKFLNQCKGTVSSEAGSWYLERDDATVNAIRQWVSENYGSRNIIISNDSILRRAGHKLPWKIREIVKKFLKNGPLQHESKINEQLDFNEVYSLFFKGKPLPSFYGKCISSRHFDAIGTGTCQILLAGKYNNILSEDIHYISLKPDYSNIEDVINRFKDNDSRMQITNMALEHCLSNHTYSHRVSKLAKDVFGI